MLTYGQTHLHLDSHLREQYVIVTGIFSAPPVRKESLSISFNSFISKFPMSQSGADEYLGKRSARPRDSLAIGRVFPGRVRDVRRIARTLNCLAYILYLQEKKN